MLESVKPKEQGKTKQLKEIQSESLLICKRCQFTITRLYYALSPEGYHEHLQCNPQGITFVFRCFSRAPGCHIRGAAVSEFSWFQGFSWQLALCQGCGEHLGWYFSAAENDNFFGLITGKIIEKKE